MAYSRSLLQHLDYISVTDPALDGTESEKYARHRDYRKGLDREALVFRDGCTPALWRLAPLTRAQYMHCWRQPSDLDKYVEAVAFGLRSVSGYEIDGRPLQVQHQKSEMGERVKSKTLDEIFDAITFGDLGEMILGISGLRP